MISLELLHGIPRPVNLLGHRCVHIPSYHPAAGLHSPELQIMFHGDMAVAGNVVKGLVSPHPPHVIWDGKENYRLLTDEDQIGRAHV